AELMWFRYHRADGARVSNETARNGDDDVPFDFEITPRFSAGFVRGDGLGVRARYWRFDHTAIKGAGTGDQDALSVNTYTIDWEVFDTFTLNCNWDVEVAAGIRYCHFREDM